MEAWDLSNSWKVVDNGDDFENFVTIIREGASTRLPISSTAESFSGLSDNRRCFLLFGKNNYPLTTYELEVLTDTTLVISLMIFLVVLTVNELCLILGNSCCLNRLSPQGGLMFRCPCCAVFTVVICGCPLTKTSVLKRVCEYFSSLFSPALHLW